MKKIFLLTIFACSALWAHAQVAFLLRTAEINDLPAENFNSVDQQPEKNAAIWFKNTYSATGKAILTLDQVKSGALLSAGQPAYKVLWVNVDTQGAERLTDPVFGSDVTDKIKEYVEAGGNLLLTKQASHIICKIGRMKYNDNSDYEPGWLATDYTVGGDIWTINAILGPNLVTRDARPHPIFDNLIECDVYSYKTFPLVGAVARTDNNIMWNDIYRKDKARINNDNNIEQMREFERDWNCQMLATWGHVVNYCAPTVVEFFPDASYKGSIIAIGAAAYQWGTSNNYISNVQKLTENALNYLKQGGDMYGYYMPYTLSEVYSIDTYRPEYLSAKWFYDNYVTTGKGRFIHKEETFPSGMKVLWVHGDRVDQNTVDFYNAMGGDGFKNKLKTFVEGGGNVFLSKQATRFANDIGRCSWAPSYGQSGYGDGSDTWYMVSNFVPIGVDRHNHPAFRYMEDYTEHNTEGYCKWPLVNGTGTYKRSDHKYMWGEPGDVWSNTYGISAGTTDIARLNAFESAQNCQILGGWGHTTALDGVGMAEFLPTATYSGTIIAQGLAAYQWTSTNTSISNVQNLTRGVLEYLNSADIYTRDVPADHYGTICLPRASASLSDGMTVYRVLSDQTDGIMLEEVNAMEAGVPYFFYSTAAQISVTMTGAAVLAPQNGNGLVGNFGPASVEIPNETDNYILGSDNTLYYIDQTGIMLGANRAYLDRSTINQSTPSGMPKRVMRIQNAPSVATALDNTGSQNIQPVKKLINGRLVIQVGDQLYDVTGAQVK